MENKIHYSIVGFFVIILATALTLAIIWLSSGFSFAEYNKYLVYMQESVAGLSIDSAVEYNGVSVGAVKSISINRQNPHLVEVLISIKNTAPITEGTVATLNTRGLTGLTYIALKDDSTNLTPLKRGKGDPYPVIHTAPSLFVRLDTALTQLTKNVKQVTDSLQNLLDEQNIQLLHSTLLNMQRITSTMSASSAQFTKIINNTAQATSELTPLLKTSSRSIKAFETQTLPLTYQLLNNLTNISRNLSETSIEIRQNPAVLVRGTSRRGDA